MKRILILTFVIFSSYLFSQNTVITDSTIYNAESTAILDVQSVHKGFLAPRMSTTQRTGIVTPAEGLLVFDTTEKQYFVFQNDSWMPLDAPAIWKTNSDSVYVSGDGIKVGVGTAHPVARLSVVGDSTAAEGEALFEVKNSDGKTIFAVYEDEVKVNFVESLKGNKGGFAVGGLTPGKADPTEYLRVTPDSVRVWFDDSGTKGAKGGFAVGGLTPGKGAPNQYLTIEKDSARIYVDNSLKGVKGGFAVGGLTPGKSAGENFLDLTIDNYFIGHKAGKNTTGSNNAFIGYQSGLDNTEGYNNVFIGMYAGESNTKGYHNLFLGNSSGYMNDSGYQNTFIGLNSGYSNVSGKYNVYIGSSTGFENVNGFENVCVGFSSGNNLTSSGNVMVGSWSGYYNTSGLFNTFIGMHSGMMNETGSQNAYVGYHAGGTGDYNVAVGSTAGIASDGEKNVFVGNQSGTSAQTGDENVLIGNRSGYSSKYVSQSVIIGSEANNESDTIIGNVFIGYQAGYYETGNNKLYISNTSTTTPLIYGEFDNEKVEVSGSVNVRDFMVLEPQSVAPSDPAKGTVYFDNNDNILKVWDGTQWRLLW